MWKLLKTISIVLIFGLVEAKAKDIVDEGGEKISLIPSDAEYVRILDAGHFVTCNGTFSSSIRWLMPNGSEVADTKGRVHVENDDHQVRLIFDKVKFEDQGRWTCLMDDDDDDKKIVEKFFNLNIYVPIVFEPVESLVITVKEGQDATLPCEVNGNPEPTLHWYFNGLSLMDKITADSTEYKRLGDGLFIHNVNRSYSGEYSCRAYQISQVMTNVDERTIVLNVQYKPTMLKHQPNFKYGFVDGEVNLTCAADGNPKPEFIWYRNGKKIFNGVIHEHDVSFLEIHVKSKDTFGEYKCRARNALGHHDHFIELVEGLKPPIPVKLALRGLSSNTFDIDVGAKKGRKNNKMDVNGFRFELIPKEVFLDDNESWSRSWIKDFAVEDDVTYLISPLSANTTYLVRVAARNIAGFSDWRTEEFQTDVNSKQSNVTSGSSRVPFSILLVVLCGIIYRQISLP